MGIFPYRLNSTHINPLTKHGSNWVEPVPTQFDPGTKHTLREGVRVGITLGDETTIYHLKVA